MGNMEVTEQARRAAARMRESWSESPPRAAIVLGSGLGPVRDAVSEPVSIPYAELPGFPQPTVTTHRGQVTLGTMGGVPVCVCEGRAHAYETGRGDAMRGVIAALAALGCEMIVLTNAAGSLHEDVGPGSLMAISDHIGFLAPNPLVGETGDGRFVDMTAAYDHALLDLMRGAAHRLSIRLAEGVYMMMPGPSFETPAEIRAARALGADAVGMSTVPETILARRHGLRVAAVSVITNLAAGMDIGVLSHEQTKAVAAVAVADLARLIVGFVDSTRVEPPSLDGKGSPR